jgi:hypothetical protein
MLQCAAMLTNMRQEVREYLRASARLFGLAYQEHALTEAEREAIVSYAHELDKMFNLPREQDGQPLPARYSVSHSSTDLLTVAPPVLTQDSLSAA